MFKYEQVKSWCAGNFVTTQSITRLKVSNIIAPTNPSMVFGFDGATPIKVASLEDLGRCLKQYPDITKQRYFGPVNAFEKLLNYVREYDDIKAIQIENIVKKYDVDTAIFMMANLLHPTSSLIFQGEYYDDLAELLDSMPIDNYNQEFVNFIKGGSLQFYLKKLGNNEAAEIVDALLLESYREDDFLYYLVKFVFSSECVSVKLGEDDISTVEELCQHIKENGFRYIEKSHNYAKICAWFYVKGYAKDIKEMKERIYKYE